MRILFSLNNALKVFFVAAITIFFVFSCKKNSSDGGATPTPVTPPDLTTQVSSSVSGFVTNENDIAASNANVQVGGTTIATDKYGYFEARNVNVVMNAATVTVTKAGYFNSVKTYIASNGKKAFFRIKLIPKTIAGTISGSTGGTVTLANGLSITLPATGVVNAITNAAYSGTVNVATYWINPTSADLPRIMPGDLRGLNTDGNLQLLTTYGMAAVELTGSGGELLQIATGKKATLSLPIPASILSTAPTTIPLWYFDEAKGLWKQEGSATKTGSNYVGNVSHFSFWNCDGPNNFVQFNCTVVNGTGQPIPYAYVKISIIGNGYGSAHGYTDSTGYVSGAVPSNAQLKLEIFDNSNCSNAVYTQNFVTTNVNISLGTILVSAPTRIATLTGSVKNCNNGAVVNGYIIINDGTFFNRYPLSNTGTYSVNKLICSFPNTISLIGEDVTGLQQSQPVTYIITNPGINNVADIIACGVSASQFFNYTDNGVSFSYTMPTDTLSYFGISTSTSISCYRIPNNTSQYSNLVCSSIIQGQTTVGSSLTVSTFSSPLTGGFTNIISGSVNVTELGPVGQFFAGNFTVTKTDAQTSTVHNIAGNFRIRRSN